MVSTYLDFVQYQKAPTGLVTSGMVGNALRLSGAVVAGQTALPVMPASGGAGSGADLYQFDSIYLFDGSNSEVVTVAADAPFPVTSVTLQAPGFQFNHGQYVLCCSDGPDGSLAEQIFTASRWIEDICYQALWQTVYTGEILTMPTMRAALTNQGGLHFRPRHFPITALSALTMQSTPNNIVAYDTSQAIIDSDQQTVDITDLVPLPNQQNTSQVTNPYTPPGVSRRSDAWLTLTYTAGFAAGALPWSVARACVLLTSDCMGQLSNPVGADTMHMGKRGINFMLRGDFSGESLLRKQAMSLLAPYIAQSF